MPNIAWPFAVVLCRFSDVAATPRSPAYYEDLLARNGTGGLCDYWRAVTHNALDLTGSRVFGWFDMSHTSSELAALTFPAGRATVFNWGSAAAAANGVDLTTFKSIIIVQNAGTDHGGLGGSMMLLVHKNPALCEFGFIAHEMGHCLGLQHSWSANPDRGYGDAWDLMSFGVTTFQFPIRFKDSQGVAAVGLNARNLEALGALPAGRSWSPPGPDFSAEITLEPLNQPLIGNHGALVVTIPPAATRPARTNGSTFTLEFRRKAGWDQAVPRDAILLHEHRADGLSYLYPTEGSSFAAGDEFVTPDPPVFIRVNRVNKDGNASIHVWDIPDGCVRKEVRGSGHYLIQGGMKHLIVGPPPIGKPLPAALRVPYNGLASLPDGADYGRV